MRELKEARELGREQARKQASRRIGTLLVRACDQLGEELADIAASGGGEYTNVAKALHILWQARWELGLGPVDIVSENEELLWKQPSAGGAS
jgi:hypothetical protein